jgi:hypothetical protein
MVATTVEEDQLPRDVEEDEDAGKKDEGACVC